MDPSVPRRRRNRLWIVLPVAMALTAAVAHFENDHGSASRAASIGPAPNAQVVHAAAVKLEADCTEVNLLSCLEKEPSGAEPVLLPWGDSGVVTVQEYVDTYFDNSSAGESIETKDLQDAGVQNLVHEKWSIPGRNQATADVIVMSFASAQGARSRALAGQGAALSAASSDGHQVAIPGLPGYAYPRRTSDAQGFVNAEYFEAVGKRPPPPRSSNSPSSPRSRRPRPCRSPPWSFHRPRRARSAAPPRARTPSVA
jgi:hypothetical protein